MNTLQSSQQNLQVTLIESSMILGLTEATKSNRTMNISLAYILFQRYVYIDIFRQFVIKLQNMYI